MQPHHRRRIPGECAAYAERRHSCSDREEQLRSARNLPHDAEKRKQACANGVSELLRLLGETLFRTYDEPTDYDEKILESFINLLKAIMPDEDYGKSFNHIIYNYGYLGIKRYMNGDEESAIRCFEEEVRLAKAFDSLPDISVSTSPVVNGAIFEKTKTNLGTNKMQSRVKHLLINRYPLSENFREKPAFKKMINSIEC